MGNIKNEAQSSQQAVGTGNSKFNFVVLYWFIEELMLLNNSLVRFYCHWVDILKCKVDERGSFTQTCSKQQEVHVCVEFVY